MGRTKSKKTNDEIEGDGGAGNVETEVLGKSAYERAVSKWKSESCYQYALVNEKSIAGTGLLHAPKSIHSSSKTTLLSWLNDHGLQGYVQNAPNSLHTISLFEGKNNNIIEPWRNYVASRTSATSSDQSLGSLEVIDLYINAGGPIWSTAFAPSSTDAVEKDEDLYISARVDKYIAVGVSQVGHRVEENSPDDGNHLLGQSETHNNLIQIWRVHGTYTHPKKAVFPTKPIPAYLLKKKLADDPNYVPKPKGRPRKYPKTEAEGDGAMNATPTPTPAVTPASKAAKEPEDTAMEVDEEQIPLSSDVSAELVYCVALQGRGPSWSCAWSPLAPADSSQQLGLLAVVNGDGSCLILQLPKSLSAEGAARSGQSSAGEEAFRRSIPVVAEAAVTLREVSVPDLLVCSVAWSTENAFMFSCGMSDGSVMVWDLNKSPSTSDSRLSAPQRHLTDLLILESQVPSMAAVRALQFCPYDSNLIVSCGQEDMKIWNLKESTGPVFRKAALSTTAAIAWDPSGFGYLYGEAETTSLTWNPLWGSGLKSLFRKELYTHSDVCGGMWGLDTFVSEGLSFVLSAASDGSVRGGYPALMTSFKSKNTSAMQLSRTRSVRPTVDEAVWEVRVENAAHVLASAIGSETFPQSSDPAMHAIHSTHLGSRPTLSSEPPAVLAPSAPTTAKKTYKKKSTLTVIDSDSEEEAGVSASATKSAKKKTPAKKTSAKLFQNDDDEEEEEAELVDTSSDSEDDDDEPAKGKGKKGRPKATSTPKAKKQPPSATKKSLVADASVVDLTLTLNIPATGPQPASLRLVACGGQAGLLRVHSFDPLRVLLAPAPPAK